MCHSTATACIGYNLWPCHSLVWLIKGFFSSKELSVWKIQNPVVLTVWLFKYIFIAFTHYSLTHHISTYYLPDTLSGIRYTGIKK